MLELSRWSFLALLLWQPAWFLWLQPLETYSPVTVLSITMIPLALLLPWVLRLNVHALVIGGCVLLPYFSFGVMEWWTTPEARIGAGTQTMLVVVYFTGMMVEFRRRKKRLRARLAEAREPDPD